MILMVGFLQRSRVTEDHRRVQFPEEGVLEWGDAPAFSRIEYPAMLSSLDA